MSIKEDPFKSFFFGAIAILFASVISPKSATANNISSLCSSRYLMTEMMISTADFDAAFCSDGYYDDSEDRCYIPVDYYYVGQSRATGESIMLSNATQSVKNGVLIWKARNENYTYQIAQYGGCQRRAWRSLSVFDDGKRVYHRIVSGNGAALPCL